MAFPNSGIFYVGDDESQSFINSHLTSTHGNSPISVPGCGPTGGNNNLTIPGSSVADGSNAVQRQYPRCVQLDGSNSTSLPTSQTQIPLSRTRRASESVLQIPNNLTQALKKSRLSMQDDDLTQLILSQRLPRQELLQQQEAQLQRQQQQLQMRLQKELQLHQVRRQQQQLQRFRGPSLYGDSVCARRLVEYLYHLRHRPSNCIGYWKNLVTEFFSPCAKKRFCLSNNYNLGHSTPGLSPQAATVKWQCNLCDSKSGRGFGFETTFDKFPRLLEIKFASSALDERLTLNTPSERRDGSGITILEYDKVVQETEFEHVRVVREGHLRLLFTPQLKILSWEFCTRRLQQLLRQVNQVAENCQSTINQSGSDGISWQNLQANSNMVMAAGSQLAKSMDSGPLHDLGFSKRHFRGLQTSEIVSSMKDKMDFCHDQKVAPIEALKRFIHRKINQRVNASRGLPPDRNNSLNKHMALRESGTNIAMKNMNGQGSVPASAQAAASAQATTSVLSNYQTMLMKQNHPKSGANNTTIKQEPSTINQNAPQGYQSSGPLLPGFGQIKQGPSTINQNASQGYQGTGPLLPGSVQTPSIKQAPSTRNQYASQGYQGSGPLLPGFVQIKQEPSTINQNAFQGYQGTGPLLPGFVHTPSIKQAPSSRNQNASQVYQGSGPLLPGFVQIKQEPSISGVSSHLSSQQQTPSSIYNGSTPQYHQQPLFGSSSSRTWEQKPPCAPAAETPSTSDTSLDVEIDFEKVWEGFCVKILSALN